MRDDKLDNILASPLPGVADNGFSRSVLKKIEARERVPLLIEIGAAVALFVVLVANIPAADVSQTLQKIVFDLGNSVPFAMACAALAATLVGMRLWAD